MNQSAVAACAETGCVAEAATGCSYVDRHSQGCPTHWCQRHVVHFAGLPYCRRHADTMAGVSGPYGTGPLPDVNDRSASLLYWMANELDVRFHDLLTARRDGAVEDLVSDDAAKPSSPVDGATGGREWQRLWGLRSGDGYPLSITLGVREGDDSHLLVRVNGRVVVEGEPPWVHRHRLHQTTDIISDRRERRAYTEQILAAVEVALDESRSELHATP